MTFSLNITLSCSYSLQNERERTIWLKLSPAVGNPPAASLSSAKSLMVAELW